MKHYLLLLLIIFSLVGQAQPKKITFQYDGAGNQVQRILCMNCNNKNSNEISKEIVAVIEEEDLEKFFPEDVLSYYPNPVREELYLRWELANGNYVKTLQVSNFNGQLLRSYTHSDQNNSQTIPFQIYPAGTYLIVLEYSSGEQKTIKIIKQ
jgi:hypothetical protein